MTKLSEFEFATGSKFKFSQLISIKVTRKMGGSGRIQLWHKMFREQFERQSADHRQALAALTDQRQRALEPPIKGWLVRLGG